MLARQLMKDLANETPEQRRARVLRECHERMAELEEQERRRPKSPLDEWLAGAYAGSCFDRFRI